MKMNGYTFAELNEKKELIEEIRSLESKLQEQTGEPITLIAYEKERAGNGERA
ncbi:hypothetical protein ACI48J_15960 [Paenibacillus chitinolyticus]|uniref:hypothetical protein n=1 Tax=Paenibacillus chitinolyticus TaxID=79263 RepID=UPI002DBB4FCD|nr:hypothetical protein [Paenibacillus chitinolyticus]MEC0249156.1 hypothetical protein [Paenibacillus chitinolyticus]